MPGSSSTVCAATDQRGFVWPVDGPDAGTTPTCDIGAFEFASNLATPTPTHTPQATPTPAPSIGATNRGTEGLPLPLVVLLGLLMLPRVRRAERM